MKKQVRLGGAVLLCAASVAGCASGKMTKTQIGTVAGAGTGAAVGAAIAKNNRLVGALFGAFAGGLIGRAIGAHLDARDQESLQKKVVEVGASGETNRPVIWQSDHSGASAVITPTGSPRIEKKSVEVTRASDVVIRPRPIEEALGTRVTTKRVNMRSGPGNEYPVKLALEPNERVTVIGKTPEGWYLLEEKGVAIGYVSGAFLVDPLEQGGRQRQGVSAERSSDKDATHTESVPRLAAHTREANLTLVRKCRPVIVKTRTPDGQVVEDKAETCTVADGSWGA